jgi:hypothetical protein
VVVLPERTSRACTEMSPYGPRECETTNLTSPLGPTLRAQEDVVRP